VIQDLDEEEMTGNVFSDNRMFTRETQEIDAVIGLTSERLDKGIIFEVFQECIKNYVLKSFKKAEDVITLIIDLKYPKQEFEEKYAPETLSDIDKEIPPKVRMWKLCFKRYLEREETLLENIMKLYGLIIG